MNRSTVSIGERPGWSGSPRVRASSDRHDDGIGDRRQVDPPHAVVEFLGQLGRDLDGEARLTCTARTGQCDEPVVDAAARRTSSI